MDSSNMNLQVINVSEFGLTNVTLKLLFINKLLHLFFKMAETDMSRKIIPFFELFLAEIAFVVGALLLIKLLPLGNPE